MYGDLERIPDAIREELLQVLRDDEGFRPFVRCAGTASRRRLLGGTQRLAQLECILFLSGWGALYDDNAFAVRRRLDSG